MTHRPTRALQPRLLSASERGGRHHHQKAKASQKDQEFSGLTFFWLRRLTKATRQLLDLQTGPLKLSLKIQLQLRLQRRQQSNSRAKRARVSEEAIVPNAVALRRKLERSLECTQSHTFTTGIGGNESSSAHIRMLLELLGSLVCMKISLNKETEEFSVSVSHEASERGRLRVEWRIVVRLCVCGNRTNQSGTGTGTTGYGSKQPCRRVGSIRTSEKALDGEEDGADVVGRGPLVLEDVEADVAVDVDVGVEAGGVEPHLGRLVGVVGGEGEPEAVGGALVGGARGSRDGAHPVKMLSPSGNADTPGSPTIISAISSDCSRRITD
ncbi:hypothetical protein EJB05_48352, partial [Eragrostis curvula]